MMLVYEGWAGDVGGENYNANRIWGEMDPRPSNRKAVVAKEITTGGATIVRGLLRMPLRVGPNRLLDVTGRRVLDLLPGANYVRALAPGVYFIREGLGTGGEGLGRTQKIVVTR